MLTWSQNRGHRRTEPSQSLRRSRGRDATMNRSGPEEESAVEDLSAHREARSDDVAGSTKFSARPSDTSAVVVASGRTEASQTAR